jgi:DNA-binding GntR family transcriptional regulator
MFGQGVTEVQQQISATLISKQLAVELNAEENSAALEIRRTYKVSDGGILQVTINTHPASRYRHSMTLHRSRS